MALDVGEIKVLLHTSVRAYKRLTVGMDDPTTAPGERPTESEARTWYQTNYPSADELALEDRFVVKCQNRNLIQ